ncbi:MAG: hypothetical protein U9O49_01920, partial [Candidatus Thermoplasmatota archaeon]|nr:hypothetical protein [Candidatus Thermoplasmatota archaeon]
HNPGSERDSKVEEIRISRPRKEKEIVSVTGDKIKEGKKVMPVQSHKSDDGDWFQGTDAIRYEIDKLTGEIDEENLDKWFEGIDDIRVKIDEKIKKKDKKKNEENT